MELSYIGINPLGELIALEQEYIITGVLERDCNKFGTYYFFITW